jgi:hypothetical protein
MGRGGRRDDIGDGLDLAALSVGGLLGRNPSAAPEKVELDIVREPAAELGRIGNIEFGTAAVGQRTARHRPPVAIPGKIPDLTGDGQIPRIIRSPCKRGD